MCVDSHNFQRTRDGERLFRGHAGRGRLRRRTVMEAAAAPPHCQRVIRDFIIGTQQFALRRTQSVFPLSGQGSWNSWDPFLVTLVAVTQDQRGLLERNEECFMISLAIAYALTNELLTAVWLKWSPLQERRLPMDFQLARNL